jgi:hypothetical protein
MDWLAGHVDTQTRRAQVQFPAMTHFASFSRPFACSSAECACE